VVVVEKIPGSVMTPGIKHIAFLVFVQKKLNKKRTKNKSILKMLEITKAVGLFLLFCIWSGVMLQERPDKYMSMGNWTKDIFFGKGHRRHWG
jgi:hypothetical protein